ncbi:TMEM165/GDT1 family protein [Pseudoalteromonas sp. SG45-5]|uniref:TMEM165/GDT1 family protein n=1 Tax=unclassified Pseudoalteromonas TaxID=194690 RepID=UPI0015F8B577|nr:MULTISPECIES: TMEM165/GDT1 family protein [unclassified Pseudoalteromonas]MBB1386646.1 TMEM165/GDT1 family protein [Pseudoalteromonas sp. SG45-5]MBB1394684.1 TMEM165/GDT1 family protein [Pseudoalteromonas sp. SG44-4]MBB1448330.1 TMEM165/GDT1 family protein [Pseudoalteromonas sp. SG41-6]
MEVFLTSTVTVTLAEIGDKTQLLSLLLAARFHNKIALIIGILAATIINHTLSAWLGDWLSGNFTTHYMPLIVNISFIVVGFWLLIPDKDEEVTQKYDHFGALLVAFVLFFIAEIGDKTQIATILLGAQYQSVFWVTLGTTAGMLIANIPIIYAGNALLQKIPLSKVRVIAASVFVLLGIYGLIAL